jgi:hypothetical protein
MALDRSTHRVLVFSQAEGSSAMMLREIVRSGGAKFVEQTTSIDRMLQSLRKNEANVLIIDDNTDLPASFVLSQLIRDPIGALTPSVVLHSTNDPKEETALERIGRPKLSPKPLTADSFRAAFKSLIDQWNLPLFKSVTQAASQLIAKNLETGLRSLISLSTNATAQPIVTPALARFLIMQKNAKAAEKVLLTSLKNSPRDLGLIISLADLYLRTAMPEHARRLLVSAKSSFGNSPAIIPDLMHCYIMLDQLGGAVIIGNELWNKGMLTKELGPIMAKIVFAEGRLSEVNRYQKSRDFVSIIEDGWNPSRSDSMSNAS